nr:hypothetical protein [uncultured Chryseobacterium sp.]
MKNLKKLNRKNLKSLLGGISNPTDGEEIGGADGGNGRSLFKCCTDNGCSTCVWGDWLNSYCLNGYLTPC